MQYTTFGRRTGLRISELALGTGNFGTGWGAGAEPEVARAMFERYVEAGGNVIDTADAYQAGQSEEIVGRLVASRRDDLVVATKYTVGTGRRTGLARTGNARKNLRLSLEGSLTRLATDHVDILWVHYPDELTPMDEILRGLDDLVTQGKVLHVALSNFPAWRVSRAAVLADVSGWAPVAGIQVEYSLVQRTADRELLPMAEALGLGATLWSPLGGGLLTGKYRHSREGRLSDWGRLVHTEDDARATAVVDTLLEVAGSVGRPPAQVAVAWLLEHGRRMTTSATPIIGPRTLAQLDDYLAALEVQLDDEGYRRLETVSRPSLGIPHEANAAALDGLRGGPGSSVTAPAVPVA